MTQLNFHQKIISKTFTLLTLEPYRDPCLNIIKFLICNKVIYCSVLFKIAKFNTLKIKIEDKSLNIVPINNCNNKVRLLHIVFVVKFCVTGLFRHV